MNTIETKSEVEFLPKHLHDWALEVQERIGPDDRLLETLADMLESGLHDTLADPDLIKPGEPGEYVKADISCIRSAAEAVQAAIYLRDNVDVSPDYQTAVKLYCDHETIRLRKEILPDESLSTQHYVGREIDGGIWCLMDRTDNPIATVECRTGKVRTWRDSPDWMTYVCRACLGRD